MFALLICSFLMLPVPSGSQNDSPQPGQIALNGIVIAVNPERNVLMVEVGSFVLPSGKKGVLSEPKSKVVTITDHTIWSAQGAPGAWVPMSMLPTYAIVTVLGKDSGSGQPIAADSVVVRNLSNTFLTGSRDQPIAEVEKAITTLLENFSVALRDRNAKQTFALLHSFIQSGIGFDRFNQEIERPNGALQMYVGKPLFDSIRPLQLPRYRGAAISIARVEVDRAEGETKQLDSIQVMRETDGQWKVAWRPAELLAESIKQSAERSFSVPRGPTISLEAQRAQTRLSPDLERILDMNLEICNALGDFGPRFMGNATERARRASGGYQPLGRVVLPPEQLAVVKRILLDLAARQPELTAMIISDPGRMYLAYITGGASDRARQAARGRP